MKKLITLSVITLASLSLYSTSYANASLRLTSLQCEDIIPNNSGLACVAEQARPIQVELLSKYKNRENVPTVQLHINTIYDTVPVTQFLVNGGACQTTFDKFATSEGVKLDGLAPVQFKVTSQCDIQSVQFTTEDRYTKYHWLFEKN